MTARPTAPNPPETAAGQSLGAMPCYTSSCGRVTLYLGDCMDIMPTLQAVDALVSDPPYGIAWKHGGSRGQWNRGEGKRKITGKVQPQSQTATIMGDAEPFDPRPLLGIAPKCLLWGAIHFSDKLPTSRHWIVWDKHLANMGTDFAEVDFAWTNYKGNAVSHRQLWNGCLVEGEERTNRNGSTRCHPTQKPIRLMIFCMDRLQIAEGETVLDPYMGSGTTGVACLRTGRRFIGIEKDPAHYATALERITTELAQGDLFHGCNREL
jgi:site-specific DNA-methyltransferase (adenine-specific)